MDKILRTLICGGQVSLCVLETTELVNEAVKIHKPAQSAAEILGGLLTCGAYLASGLKSEKGCVSLTVKAKDGDGAVSVSADSALNVRGYVDGSCENTLVGGTLTVVREDEGFKPFVGTIEITSDDVSEILEAYFQQSEQIPTAVIISAEFDGENCLGSGGVIMQLLPDADDEQTEIAGEAFSRFAKGFNAAEFDAQSATDGYFAQHIGGGVTSKAPRYKCNCSEEKIRGVLASVGKAELLKICDELGEVKVHCHYCNRDYTYDKERIEDIF